MEIAGLGLEAWSAVILVIAAGVLGILYALSATIRDFQRAVVLSEQVAELRRKQSERLAAIRARTEGHAPARTDSPAGATSQPAAHAA